MKLSLSAILYLRSQPAYQKLLNHFFSSARTRTDSANAERCLSLYRRISPIGDPRVSVTPILEQWVHEGRPVTEQDLRRIITALIDYRRYTHALEISHWMSDGRYIPLSQVDVATRLNLIYRVHGLEQAERDFSDIPLCLRGWVVHVTLLNCYSHAKAVLKAESLMQVLQEIDIYRIPTRYNIMMDLYLRMGSWDKLDTCMREMEENGINWDKYTLGIRLGAYVATCDVEGIDNLMTRMESDPHIDPNFVTYAVAANGYIKVGQLEKALEVIKKAEELMPTAKKRTDAFHTLLGLYSSAGKRDELYGTWNLYKKETIYNKGYTRMMQSLLKLNDIGGAEKIFKEWESKDLVYDFRITDALIGAYCRNGLLEKAEALVVRGIASEGKPTFSTWYYLAEGYLQDNQVQKAVEPLKKAIAAHSPSSKPRKDALMNCLEYLEGRGDMRKADAFIGSLVTEGVFSAVVHERLLDYISNKR